MCEKCQCRKDLLITSTVLVMVLFGHFLPFIKCHTQRWKKVQTSGLLCIIINYHLFNHMSNPIALMSRLMQIWLTWQIMSLQENFMPVYTGHLRDIIKKGIDCKEDYEKPLKGFKFAVDAGNGGGGFLATDVLAELGADTSGLIQNPKCSDLTWLELHWESDS